MEVKLSKRATLQINDSLSFVAKVSKEAASVLLKEIKDKLLSLSTFPYSGPSLSDQPVKGVDMRKITLSDGRYGFIYAVLKEYIYVYYFVDFRMDSIIAASEFEKI